MCIRDRTAAVQQAVDAIREQKDNGQIRRFTGNDYLDDLASGNVVVAQAYSCLLYTSDAADERSSVDLGGRRILKKKTQ